MFHLSSPLDGEQKQLAKGFWTPRLTGTYQVFDVIVVDQNDDDRVQSLLAEYDSGFDYVMYAPGLSLQWRQIMLGLGFVMETLRYIP